MTLAANSILVASFFAALLVIHWRIKNIPGGKWSGVIPGEGEFDPKNSWASTVTILGALLNTAALKEFVRGDGEIYGLIFFFAALAVSAFPIYAASIREGEKSHESPVWAYLLSSLVALWAALGQVSTLALIIAFPGAKRPTGFVAFVFLVALLIAAAAVSIYAYKVMAKPLRASVPKPAPETDGDAKSLQDSVSKRATAELTQPAPVTWTLL